MQLFMQSHAQQTGEKKPPEQEHVLPKWVRLPHEGQ